MVEKLDLSILQGMNIPEINSDPKNEIRILKDEELEEIREDAVGEVESLKDFSTNKEEELEDFPEEPGAPIVAYGETPEPEKEAETSIVKGIAEYLKSENLFDYKEEEFEDNPDFLMKKINEVADAKVDEKLKEFPEVIYELAKNYKEGVPLDELIYSKSREIEYHAIKEEELTEDKELQKKLVSAWLEAQEYDQDEIDKKVTKYDDALILEDEALTALKKLRVYEQKYQEGLKEAANKKKEQEQKSYQTQLTTIQKDIEDSSEIIPGLELNPDEKKKIFDAYTKPDSKGETLLMKKLKADPKAWYKVTQFMVLMDGNLDSVKNKIKTEVVKTTKQTVSSYKETPGINKIDLSTVKRALDRVKNSRK